MQSGLRRLQLRRGGAGATDSSTARSAGSCDRQPWARTFWKSDSRPGMEVAGVGRGLAAWLVVSSSRSSSPSASLVTGSRPVSCRGEGPGRREGRGQAVQGSVSAGQTAEEAASVRGLETLGAGTRCHSTQPGAGMVLGRCGGSTCTGQGMHACFAQEPRCPWQSADRCSGSDTHILAGQAPLCSD